MSSQPASLLLSASLAQRPGGRLWRTLRWPMLLLEFLGGNGSHEPLPRGRTDLVVRWRDRAAELLRVRDADDQLLNYVTKQLDELTVEAFCERWGVSPSSTGDEQ